MKNSDNIKDLFWPLTIKFLYFKMNSINKRISFVINKKINQKMIKKNNLKVIYKKFWLYLLKV